MVFRRLLSVHQHRSVLTVLSKPTPYELNTVLPSTGSMRRFVRHLRPLHFLPGPEKPHLTETLCPSLLGMLMRLLSYMSLAADREADVVETDV